MRSPFKDRDDEDSGEEWKKGPSSPPRPRPSITGAEEVWVAANIREKPYKRKTLRTFEVFNGPYETKHLIFSGQSRISVPGHPEGRYLLDIDFNPPKWRWVVYG